MALILPKFKDRRGYSSLERMERCSDMDLNKVSLFGMMKQRLAWLGQRQEVLAQNIANADTPGYRPRDIKPLEFRGMVNRQLSPVTMEVTHGNHLAGHTRNVKTFDDQVNRTPYETAPAGNAVILKGGSEALHSNRVLVELCQRN